MHRPAAASLRLERAKAPVPVRVTLEDLKEKLRLEGRLVISAKVISRSSRNEIAGVGEDGTLKLKILAAPEKGRANGEICDFLAATFGVPRKGVAIIRGFTSPHKHIQISF